jgi:Domain of unknown function (DUF4386)
MTDRIAESSPRLRARIAGALYLIVIATAMFAESFVRDPLIVSGNAAATAHNILASEQLFRLGFAADLANFACYIAVVLIFYGLFKPAGRTLSLVAAGFGMAGCITGAVNMINQLAPVVLLRGAPYLSAFKSDQLQAVAYVFLKLHTYGYAISMTFFGIYCVLLGYLVLRSTFLPRILGVLLAIGGAGYLTNSFAIFLSPAFAAQLGVYTLLPGFVAEVSLTLWLIVVGVNTSKWRTQAGVAGAVSS